MALIIDPLSIATQGYLETPSTPNVEARRDALRFATLGWIILDFIGLPDPNQPTDAIIQKPCTWATIVSSETTFKAVSFCSSANVTPIVPSAKIKPHKTTFDVELFEADARIRPSKATSNIDASTAQATIKVGKATAGIEASEAGADIQKGKATATMEPKDES